MSQSQKTPERRCIVTGEVRPKEELIRFGVGPDGTVVPDIEERLPGRGIWVSARRDMVEKAIAKKLFSRAAKANVTPMDGMIERIEDLLVKRCTGYLGLMRKANGLVAGFEKAQALLRSGKVAALVAASDGSDDGRSKLRALAGEVPVVGVLDGDELGSVLGRERVVHMALSPGRICGNFLKEADRLAGFRQIEDVE